MVDPSFADAYFRFSERMGTLEDEEEDADEWAWELFIETARENLTASWGLLMTLVNAADESQLLIVAAGAFTHLVHSQVSDVMDLVIGEARRNPRFREMMRHSMKPWHGFVTRATDQEIDRILAVP